MLSRQKPTGQGTPCYQPISIGLEELLIFILDLFSDKHVVLILRSDGLVEVVLFTESESVKNILSVPVACSPIECLTLFNRLMEGPADFLQWSVLVVSMCEKNVDVFQLKSLKRLVDGLLDVLLAYICR